MFKYVNQFLKTNIEVPTNLKYILKWFFNRKQKSLDYLWMPFSINDWLEERLTGEERVFEWGSGSSTIWFEKRTREIISVEDNSDWYIKVKADLNKNNSKLLFKTGEDYINCIKDKGKFDIIVIDGRQREKCFDIAKNHLKPNGIIIYDDVHLKNRFSGDKKVFSKIFKGIAPYKAFSNWQTGVFKK